MKIRLYIKNNLQEGAEIELSPEDSHYLQNVLRVQTSDEIFAFNPQDGEFLAICIKAKNTVKLKINSLVKPCIPEERQIHLFFGNIKNNLVSDVLNACTQIGVTEFTPMLTKYTVNRFFNLERGEKIIKEACEQSERITIPKLNDLANFQDVCKNLSKYEAVLFCDEKSIPARQVLRNNYNKIAILIGCEGGFAEEERKLISSLSNAHTINLGKYILKAENACACACFLAVNNY